MIVSDNSYVEEFILQKTLKPELISQIRKKNYIGRFKFVLLAFLYKLLKVVFFLSYL